MTKDNFGALYDLNHEIKLRNGKRVCVCIEHFCDLDGISEYNYLKKTRKGDGK